MTVADLSIVPSSHQTGVSSAPPRYPWTPKTPCGWRLLTKFMHAHNQHRSWAVTVNSILVISKMSQKFPIYLFQCPVFMLLEVERVKKRAKKVTQCFHKSSKVPKFQILLWLKATGPYTYLVIYKQHKAYTIGVDRVDNR